MSSRYLPSGRSLYLPANIQKIQKIQKSQHPRIPTSEYSREFRYSVDLFALLSQIFAKRLSHFSYFVASRLHFHISISSCCSRSKLHTSKHSLVSRHVHLLFEQFFQIFKILQTACDEVINQANALYNILSSYTWRELDMRNHPSSDIA
jgi:hypothetical protein